MEPLLHSWRSPGFGEGRFVGPVMNIGDVHAFDRIVLIYLINNRRRRDFRWQPGMYLCLQDATCIAILKPTSSWFSSVWLPWVSYFAILKARKTKIRMSCINQELNKDLIWYRWAPTMKIPEKWSCNGFVATLASQSTLCFAVPCHDKSRKWMRLLCIETMPVKHTMLQWVTVVISIT